MLKKLIIINVKTVQKQWYIFSGLFDEQKVKKNYLKANKTISLKISLLSLLINLMHFFFLIFKDKYKFPENVSFFKWFIEEIIG